MAYQIVYEQSKRVVEISDLHCGHRVGLTPPNWQNSTIDSMSSPDKWNKIQIELWTEYERMVKTYGKPFLLVVLGDAVDGCGYKTGGTELIVRDRDEQCKMAKACIDPWEAEHIVMVRGTGYHVGKTEQWEDVLADMINPDKIGDQEWVEVNNTIFDCKHFIGNNSVPSSQGNALGNDRLWNLIWADYKESQVRADIILRGHVHSFDYRGSDDWLAVTVPALQGLGSRFGSRIPSKIVKWGITYYDCFENGGYSWGWDTVQVETQKAKVIRF